MPDRSPVHEGDYARAGFRRTSDLSQTGVRLGLTLVMSRLKIESTEAGSDPRLACMRPAVFLDRDGTLIEERGYLDRLDLLELFPWTVDAIRLLNRAGFAPSGRDESVRQSAVASSRSRFSITFTPTIDARLAAGGARMEAYYFCPHHPDAELEPYRQRCRCRKPRPGHDRAGLP